MTEQAKSGQALAAVLAHLLTGPPGATLTTAQAQRVTCLAMALHLTAGRSVPWQLVMGAARWLYNGGDD